MTVRNDTNNGWDIASLIGSCAHEYQAGADQFTLKCERVRTGYGAFGLLHNYLSGHL